MDGCPMQGSRPFSTFALSVSCFGHLNSADRLQEKATDMDIYGNGMVSFEAFK